MVVNGWGLQQCFEGFEMLQTSLPKTFLSQPLVPDTGFWIQILEDTPHRRGAHSRIDVRVRLGARPRLRLRILFEVYIPAPWI